LSGAVSLLFGLGAVSRWDLVPGLRLRVWYRSKRFEKRLSRPPFCAAGNEIVGLKRGQLFGNGQTDELIDRYAVNLCGVP